jgi:hypothetical protein
MKRLIIIPLLFLSVYIFAQAGGVTIDRTATPIMWTFPGDIIKNHASGLMYVSTGGTVTITTGGTYQKMLGGAVDYTAAHLEDVNETTNGRLTYIGTATKHFLVTINATIESGEANQEIQIRVAENAASIAGSDQSQAYGAVNNHNTIATAYLVELATNDYIEVFITSDQDSDAIIVHSCVLTLIEY